MDKGYDYLMLEIIVRKYASAEDKLTNPCLAEVEKHQFYKLNGFPLSKQMYLEGESIPIVKTTQKILSATVEGPYSSGLHARMNLSNERVIRQLEKFFAVKYK